jgi:hypothetical protein
METELVVMFLEKINSSPIPLELALTPRSVAGELE